MTLYDAYGRLVDTAPLREEQAGPTLAGIRNIYSVMHPSVGLTPEKLTAILRQAEFGDPFLYLELAEEMEEKDTHYLSVLETRKQTLRAAGSGRPPGFFGGRRCSRRRSPQRPSLQRILPARRTSSSTFWTPSAKAIPWRRSSGTLPASNGFPDNSNGATRDGFSSTG